MAKLELNSGSTLRHLFITNQEKESGKATRGKPAQYISYLNNKPCGFMSLKHVADNCANPMT